MTDPTAKRDTVPNPIEDYGNEVFNAVDAIAAFVDPTKATQAAGQKTTAFVLGLGDAALMQALGEARKHGLISVSSIEERYGEHSVHNQDESAASRQAWIENHPTEVAQSAHLADTVNTTVDPNDFRQAIEGLLQIAGLAETSAGAPAAEASQRGPTAPRLNKPKV